MKTIALRFGENLAPECGTIAAHQKIIDVLGYVWYGKFGSTVSKEVISDLKYNDDPKILLINSGTAKRFWAHVLEIRRDTPPLDAIPAYYRDMASKINTWFKIKKFEPAPRDIMGRCRVISSGNKLAEASKGSMSPYFIIEVEVPL